MEVSWQGNRLLMIENEKIKITLLPDKGCDIVDFNYKENDTSFLWRTPKGLKSLDRRHVYYSDIFNQAYHGGWFEAFPNVGLNCTYKGIDFSPYDEVMYLPWYYQVLKDTAGEVEIKCCVKTLKTPFLLEKTIKLISQSPAVQIHESIKNLGREEISYQWGHHPLLGEPFLSGNCIIDLPGGDINTYFEFDNARVEQGVNGTWPHIDGRQGSVDLRHFPEKGADINDLYWLSNLKGSWAAVRNTGKGIGFGLAWDSKMFNNCLIWINANGDREYPYFGKVYTLCILPSTSDTHTIEAETGKGIARKLHPDETTTSWITATVFTETKKRPSGISQEGDVSF